MKRFPNSGAMGRFALIASGLCRAVAACLGRGLMSVAMILLVSRRIRRAEALLLALVERTRLGRTHLREGRMREGRVRPLPDDDRAALRQGRAPKAGDWCSLPRRFGWLNDVMPHEAAGYASQLQSMLAEPDMVALLRDVPQAGRILGPLCRMLGVAAAVLTPVGEVLVPAVERIAAGPAPDRRSVAAAPAPWVQPGVGMAWLRFIPD